MLFLSWIVLSEGKKPAWRRHRLHPVDGGGGGADWPLRGGIRAVERVSELDDGAVLVLQDPVLRRVVVHQLRQRGELLPAVQVIVVARVLDPDVGHRFTHPAQTRRGRQRGISPDSADHFNLNQLFYQTGVCVFRSTVGGKNCAFYWLIDFFFLPDWEGKIACVFFAGPSQEAAVNPSTSQDFLGLQACDVSVEPPGTVQIQSQINTGSVKPD